MMMKDLPSHLSSCPYSKKSRSGADEKKIYNLCSKVTSLKLENERLTQSSVNLRTRFYGHNEVDEFSRYLLHLREQPNGALKSRIYQNVGKMVALWKSDTIEDDFEILQVVSLALNNIEFTRNQMADILQWLSTIFNHIQK